MNTLRKVYLLLVTTLLTTLGICLPAFAGDDTGKYNGIIIGVLVVSAIVIVAVLAVSFLKKKKK